MDKDTTNKEECFDNDSRSSTDDFIFDDFYRDEDGYLRLRNIAN